MVLNTSKNACSLSGVLHHATSLALLEEFLAKGKGPQAAKQCHEVLACEEELLGSEKIRRRQDAVHVQKLEYL